MGYSFIKTKCKKTIIKTGKTKVGYMKKITSQRAVRCPKCDTLTPRVFLAGKQALCINSKCSIQRFTVQAYPNKRVKEGKATKNRSYNNSGRRNQK